MRSIRLIDLLDPMLTTSHATPLIAACARNTGGAACFDYANLLGYDSGTSKEVGLGIPEVKAQQPRHPHRYAVFPFPGVARGTDSFLAGRAGHSQGCAGSLTRYTNLHGLPPSFGIEVAGLNPVVKEPIMANTATTGISAAPELSAFAPELTVVDGQITTTSLQVAEHFGKRHDRVLRAIRNLIADLPADHLPIFGEIQIDVDLGMGRTRQDPAFRLTRDGFTLLAMGFTGKEALQWKLAYLGAFNKMESELVKLTTAPALPATITPAQAQHLRELVQLVVETGKQSHGETWTRLHRKMKTNSYLELRPDQFDAACQYLRGKFDGESIAAIAQKHFPHIAQLPAPTPEPKPMPTKLSPAMLVSLINGGCLADSAVRDIAMASANNLYRNACMSPSGYGEEVARKITHDLPMADLHAIVVRSTMEMTLRVHGYDIAQQAAAQ